MTGIRTTIYATKDKIFAWVPVIIFKALLPAYCTIPLLLLAIRKKFMFVQPWVDRSQTDMIQIIFF